MDLHSELESSVKNILSSKWDCRDGKVIPLPEDVKLGNDSIKLEGTVLYADLDGSTIMVDKYTAEFSAEIYKAYLLCAAKIIRAEGGEITAYDGDRIMAVFIGNSKNSSAAKTALKINYAVNHIINPAILIQYPETQFQIKQVVGIDSSNLTIARIGVKGFNDLVWVGRAANYAAKLTTLSGASCWLTSKVFSLLNDESKYGQNSLPMWTKTYWPKMNNIEIYYSNWWWRI